MASINLLIIISLTIIWHHNISMGDIYKARYIIRYQLRKVAWWFEGKMDLLNNGESKLE